jgi:hypothetical protein
VGDPDLSPPQDENLRGLVIFPAALMPRRHRLGEWWLVIAAAGLAAAMIAIAFAVR